jgi:hypothetical protein
MHTDISMMSNMHTDISMMSYQSYSVELEIKDTTESDISASYLDILLNADSSGRLISTLSLHDKFDESNFAIVNFLFLCNVTCSGHPSKY